MSKPLDLAVYQTFWLGGCLWTSTAPGASFSNPLDVDLVASAKRFTDAEMAAEFHSARADWNEASRHPSKTYWTPLGVDEDATEETAMKRATTFLRFVTLPHYDEATA